MGGGGDVLDYQTVNLPWQVEQHFNTVLGNGWEMQLAKNKDPKISAVMRKLGFTGSTLSFNN
jgi:hypothetical protein